MKNRDAILLDKEKPTNLKRAQSSRDIFFISSVVYISAANFSHPSRRGRDKFESLSRWWRSVLATDATSVFFEATFCLTALLTPIGCFVRTFQPITPHMLSGPEKNGSFFLYPAELFPHILTLRTLLLKYYIKYVYSFCRVGLWLHQPELVY